MNFLYNLFLEDFSRKFPEFEMSSFPFHRYEKFLEEYYFSHKFLTLNDFVIRVNHAFHHRLELENRKELFSNFEIPRGTDVIEFKHKPDSPTINQVMFIKEGFKNIILKDEKDNMESAIRTIKEIANKYAFTNDDEKRSDKPTDR